MGDQTVVLITGVARGIGNELAKKYLLRSNHTVIGAVRDPSAANVADLQNTPKGEGSKLLVVKIDSASAEDPARAVEEIRASGIEHLDVVIANAGVCPVPAPIDTTSREDVSSAFTINVLGPMALFQAVKDLLQKSTKKPKWISLASNMGSVGLIEEKYSYLCFSYGLSKSALNWATVAIHAGHDWLIAIAMQPGLVQSDMGNTASKYIGLEEAPDTLENSIGQMMNTIDGATREETSGKFVDVINGTTLPW